jgi:hypothetical protein
VACETFQLLQSRTFSDICMTNKRKQNNRHRSLEVLKWKKGDQSVQDSLLPMSNYSAVLL